MKDTTRKSKKPAKRLTLNLNDSEEFTTQLKSWMRANKISRKECDYNMLRELMIQVENRGGWWKVMEYDLWEEIARNYFPSKSATQIHKTFCKHLFAPWLDTLQNFPPKIKAKMKSTDLKPKNLSTIPVVTPPENGMLTRNWWKKVLSQDIVILRGFFEPWGIDNSLFDLDHIIDNFGSDHIQILRQIRHPASMTVPRNKKHQSTIAEYGSYIKSFDETERHRTIDFGVNIDIGNWKTQIDELRKKLPRCLLWQTDEDALSYLHQHVLGVTLPQAYLKVNGCWTGLHEENLRLFSININHGPADCTWWAIHPKHSDKLHSLVKKNFEFDIHLNETGWWPDPYYLLAKNFEVYTGVQKPGDLIIVSYGTPHWVRGYGTGVQTAWNVGPKNLKQLSQCLAKAHLNRDIGMPSIVTMSTLSLDLLNYEMATNSPQVNKLLMKEVNRAFKKENKQMSALCIKPKLDNQNYTVSSCEDCTVEIFWVYGLCKYCIRERIRMRDGRASFFCIPCMVKHDCGNRKARYLKKFEERELDTLEKRVAEGNAEIQNELVYYNQSKWAGLYESPYQGIPNVSEVPEKPPTPQKRKASSKSQSPRKKKTPRLSPQKSESQDILDVEPPMMIDSPTKVTIKFMDIPKETTTVKRKRRLRKNIPPEERCLTVITTPVVTNTEVVEFDADQTNTLEVTYGNESPPTQDPMDVEQKAPQISPGIKIKKTNGNVFINIPKIIFPNEEKQKKEEIKKVRDNFEDLPSIPRIPKNCDK